MEDKTLDEETPAGDCLSPAVISLATGHDSGASSASDSDDDSTEGPGEPTDDAPVKKKRTRYVKSFCPRCYPHVKEMLVFF